jgi:hypothetical protein
MNATLTATAPSIDTPASPPISAMSAPPATPAQSWRQAKVDVFEAALLIRCTGITSPRYPRLGRPAPLLPPTVFAEFSEAAPADRLSHLLRAAGVPTSRDEVSAGGRWRYQVQRVNVPESCIPSARRRLDDAWQEGWNALLSTSATGSSSPQRSHRAALAAAAWRAALLAGGRRPRAQTLGVRVSDRDTAAVLLRGARMLGVPANMLSRTGCWLLTVPAGAPMDALLHAIALPR